MDTTRWGPHAWVLLHTIAHNFDPELHDKEKFMEFFTILGDVLPCIHCRNSYKEFMEELPIEPYINADDRLALHYWLYQMHNKVNNKLRNQGLLETPDPSFKAICLKYDQYKAECSRKKKNKDVKSKNKSDGGAMVTCRIPNSSSRCQAKTDKGHQCTRKVADKNCKRCKQHKNSNAVKYSKK